MAGCSCSTCLLDRSVPSCVLVIHILLRTRVLLTPQHAVFCSNSPLSIVCDGEKTKLARNPASATPLATLSAVERDERTRRDKFSAHAKPTRTLTPPSLSLSLLQVDKREGTVLRDAVRLIEILGVRPGRQSRGLKRTGWTRLLGARGFQIQKVDRMKYSSIQGDTDEW